MLLEAAISLVFYHLQMRHGNELGLFVCLCTSVCLSVYPARTYALTFKS